MNANGQTQWLVFKTYSATELAEYLNRYTNTGWSVYSLELAANSDRIGWGLVFVKENDE